MNDIDTGTCTSLGCIAVWMGLVSQPNFYSLGLCHSWMLCLLVSLVSWVLYRYNASMALQTNTCTVMCLILSILYSKSKGKLYDQIISSQYDNVD